MSQSTLRPRDMALAFIVIVVWGVNFAAIKLGFVGMPLGLASLVLQAQTFFSLVLTALWLKEKCTATNWPAWCLPRVD